MSKLKLRVTDNGWTKVDPDHGRVVSCALKWVEQSTWGDAIVDMLTSTSNVTSIEY